MFRSFLESLCWLPFFESSPPKRHLQVVNRSGVFKVPAHCLGWPGQAVPVCLKAVSWAVLGILGRKTGQVWGCWSACILFGWFERGKLILIFLSSQYQFLLAEVVLPGFMVGNHRLFCGCTQPNLGYPQAKTLVFVDSLSLMFHFWCPEKVHLLFLGPWDNRVDGVHGLHFGPSMQVICWSEKKCRTPVNQSNCTSPVWENTRFVFV